MTPAAKKSLVARTLKGDVLEALGNATAVAVDLLEGVNATLAAGRVPATSIPGITAPIVTRDLITSASALGDDVLQTLLNATAVADQLLGAVIPVLVAHSDTGLNGTYFR
ncbi:hypothetical protein V1508DRAFT_463046 [Lipomyces doorenjongii]|uniref:uncharacterized protein n=1 Tax=Lipomyces doorenjongii TaxID=383834 RepID=UPI0034CE8D7C